jgi:hypothetical protein
VSSTKMLANLNLDTSTNHLWKPAKSLKFKWSNLLLHLRTLRSVSPLYKQVNIPLTPSATTEWHFIDFLLMDTRAICLKRKGILILTLVKKDLGKKEPLWWNRSTV